MAIQIPYTDGFITPEGGNNFESKNNKGQVNGYAPLDANAKVPTANLPDQADITAHNSATTSVHGIANTANLVLTNDSRLSDPRAPTAHVHGNITNAGAVGSTANLPLITTTSGVVTTGTFGTTANTFCQGNDSRFASLQATLTAFAIALG